MNCFGRSGATNARVFASGSRRVEERNLRYEGEQPGLGERFSREVTATVASIELTPKRFAKYEGKRLRYECRRALLTDFPYLIVYQISNEIIRVIAVAHSSREPGYWEKE